MTEQKQDEILISFQDVKRLLGRHKRKILQTASFFFLITFLFLVTRPVQFEAQGSFREKGKSRSGLGDGLGTAFVLLSEGQSDSDALTMMSSYSLIEDVIRDQGLQGVITKEEYTFPFFSPTTIKNNLIGEYVSFINILTPLALLPEQDLKTDQVIYSEEVPIQFRVKVTSRSEYTVEDGYGTTIGHGHFGIPFATAKYAFSISTKAPDDVTGNTYKLTLYPIRYVAKTLRKQFTFAADKNDKTMLQIQHRNIDREQAAKNINRLMTVYLHHIQSEHENMCQTQINYLRERQEDVGNQIETMMTANAEKLSKELSSTGFASSDKAMEFFAANQQSLELRLLSLELLIQQLEGIRKEKNNFSEIVNEDYAFLAINKITGEKRKLLQESDSIQLALNHTLNKERQKFDERELERMKLGLGLEVAREIYVGYVKEQNDLESQMRQHKFVVNKMEQEGFELTPLCTILTDPISMEMINKTNGLLLSLKDGDNRSTREQERILSDLSIQKNALMSHVQQTLLLLNLRQDFVMEKIVQFQHLLLSLIEEQLYVLEGQLQDNLSSTIANIYREKQLIEKNVADLRIEMAKFPEQWAAEQLISQQMNINQSLISEVSKVVESKNISNNLERFQSTPVDLAVVPIHPKPPRLILFSIVSAFVGAFLASIWVLGRSVINGIEASPENLSASGYRVAGTLSKKGEGNIISDNDLDTLRRILTDTSHGSKEKHKRSLMLIEGDGPDYAVGVAELLAKMEMRVLVLNARFDDYAAASAPGLLQYLEGKVSELKIVKGALFDYAGSGGVSRYSNELLGKPAFNALLEQLSKSYDRVIISSRAMPESAEVEALLDQFPYAVITLSGQTVEQIRPCFVYAKTPGHQVSFVFV